MMYGVFKNTGVSVAVLLGCALTARAGQEVSLAKYSDQFRQCLDQHIASRLLPACTNNNEKGATVFDQFNPKNGDFLYVKRCRPDASHPYHQVTLTVYQTHKELKFKISDPMQDSVKRLMLDDDLAAVRFASVDLKYFEAGENKGRVDREHSILSDPDFPVFIAISPFPDAELLWDDEGRQPSVYKINFRNFAECTERGF